MNPAWPAVDGWVTPGEWIWWCGMGAAAIGRGADLMSTWLATPRLKLEGNPFARWLGWKGGLWLNGVMIPLVAMWPMLAISMATTSCLVAARNLQQAWLMRSMGEDRYRMWMAMRVMESPRWLMMVSFLGEAGLTGAVGLLLMLAGPWHVVSFGVGLGISAYGLAVGVFTVLSLRRGV